MKFRFACLLLLPMLAFGQSSKPIIDNDRVTVWDTTWTKAEPASGERSFSAPPDYDVLTVWLTGGDIATSLPGGKSRAVKHKAGDAVFTAKGARLPETWDGAGATPRTVVIALKDHAVPPIPNPSGLPLAFPRPGAKKLIDNNRILVWDYTWTPGEETPMHFHDKDVVVVYLEDGDLTSVTPDGKSTVNPYKFGDVRFNFANRSHKEVVSKGNQRAIITELK
jgi:hypothetical protein